MIPTQVVDRLSEKPKKKFTIFNDVIMLTYPDVGQKPKDILTRIEKLNGFKGGVVAFEIGDEGHPHFHCWAQFHSHRVFTKEVLDVIGGIHGNYVPIRKTPFKALAYIIKDNNYIVSEGFEEIVKNAIVKYSYGDMNNLEFFGFCMSKDPKFQARNFKGKPKEFHPFPENKKNRINTKK